MSTLMILLGMSGLIGSALVGGVFLAFSSFVMKALARVPSREGIARVAEARAPTPRSVDAVSER